MEGGFGSSERERNGQAETSRVRDTARKAGLRSAQENRPAEHALHVDVDPPALKVPPLHARTREAGVRAGGERHSRSERGGPLRRCSRVHPAAPRGEGGGGGKGPSPHRRKTYLHVVHEPGEPTAVVEPGLHAVKRIEPPAHEMQLVRPVLAVAVHAAVVYVDPELGAAMEGRSEERGGARWRLGCARFGRASDHHLRWQAPAGTGRGLRPSAPEHVVQTVLAPSVPALPRLHAVDR